MRVSDIFKKKAVEKVVDPGFTKLEGGLTSFKDPELQALQEKGINEGIPSLLADVQSLASKTREEVNTTIEYVKSTATSIDFKDYLTLIEQNYVPLETLLEEGAVYPQYTAPISEINKLEKKVRESNTYSEPFLHSLFLHLNRSEVLDHMLNKVYEPVLRSVYGIGTTKDKNNKPKKQSFAEGLYKQTQEFTAGDNTNLNNNLAVKYLLYKSKDELKNILDYALRLRRDYRNPVEEELNDFVSYFISTRGKINRQTFDLLFEKHVRDYESLWQIPKTVFVQQYSNPLNSFLTEMLSIQLSKIVGSINEEVDDLIEGVEDYINITGSATLGIVNTILKNSVAETAINLRSLLGYREATLIKEEQAREGTINARFLEQIIKSVRGINQI